ncbi:MAG TPA: aminomethyltransferase family protein [Candidatus Limnocylindrales bacterium]|nr:aminomethyltransferase family protein [Candidatus Limnocylindrales bacterium]
MIRTTPFHERTSALNETGLWEHWANCLVAQRYQMSEKFEYFGIRNVAGLFDTSPLYKYRFSGPDAERYLSGVLARDSRKLAVGRAQYTLWCDDRGYVLEDGVLLRVGEREYLLTAAEPNLAYFQDLAGSLDVAIEDVTEDWGILSIQGPRSREILASVAPAIADLAYFALTRTKVAGVDVLVSRTGYTGDLGYEIWVPGADALPVWDAIWGAGEGRGLLPFGMTALYMARIEAGLLLIDVDFRSSRYAWTDADRSTPLELGLGWMFRDLAPGSGGANSPNGRAFIGRDAIKRELRDRTSRWKLTGLVVDWQDYDRIYDEAGLIPPKDHSPIQEEFYVYDEALNQLGYATSQMYSPMLQRHIALARVPLDRQDEGSRVKLEAGVRHRYEYFDAAVSKLPLFNPQRRTA